MVFSIIYSSMCLGSLIKRVAEKQLHFSFRFQHVNIFFSLYICVLIIINNWLFKLENVVTFIFKKFQHIIGLLVITLT